eukprot:GHVH01010834.1.p1 GENE.GHVH01010834.1~~GHVH01010834.1.p1  ORF type:complete len:640 (+),score=76.44 GHVH01010834.1:280-1920(+)
MRADRQKDKDKDKEGRRRGHQNKTSLASFMTSVMSSNNVKHKSSKKLKELDRNVKLKSSEDVATSLNRDHHTRSTKGMPSRIGGQNVDACADQFTHKRKLENMKIVRQITNSSGSHDAPPKARRRHASLKKRGTSRRRTKVDENEPIEDPFIMDDDISACCMRAQTAAVSDMTIFEPAPAPKQNRDKNDKTLTPIDTEWPLLKSLMIPEFHSSSSDELTLQKLPASLLSATTLRELSDHILNLGSRCVSFAKKTESDGLSGSDEWDPLLQCLTRRLHSLVIDDVCGVAAEEAICSTVERITSVAAESADSLQKSTIILKDANRELSRSKVWMQRDEFLETVKAVMIEMSLTVLRAGTHRCDHIQATLKPIIDCLVDIDNSSICINFWNNISKRILYLISWGESTFRIALELSNAAHMTLNVLGPSTLHNASRNCRKIINLAQKVAPVDETKICDEFSSHELPEVGDWVDGKNWLTFVNQIIDELEEKEKVLQQRMQEHEQLIKMNSEESAGELSRLSNLGYKRRVGVQLFRKDLRIWYHNIRESSI